MAVLGCQSGKALRRFAKSLLKKWVTPSFAIKSRNDQGICETVKGEKLENNSQSKSECRTGGGGGTTHGSLRNRLVLYWHQSVERQVPGARLIHDPSEKGN
jgi:hypothetical protein